MLKTVFLRITDLGANCQQYTSCHLSHFHIFSPLEIRAIEKAKFDTEQKRFNCSATDHTGHSCQEEIRILFKAVRFRTFCVSVNCEYFSFYQKIEGIISVISTVSVSHFNLFFNIGFAAMAISLNNSINTLYFIVTVWCVISNVIIMLCIKLFITILIVCTSALGGKNNETIKSTKKQFINVFHRSQNSC